MAKLIFAVRYIAIFVLIIAILLIIIRAKFPSENRAQGTCAYWRDVWRRIREYHIERKERAADLRALRGKTALLVDPDTKSVRVMSWRLDAWKCRILLAANGSKGLALTGSNQVDFALVDTLLSDMSASDFYYSLGESDIPVVFLGVLNDQYEELRHLGRNTRCFAKPYDPDEVLALVGYMLRKSKT